MCQKLNEYHTDVTTIPKTLATRREAKKWLARKHVKNFLIKSAFNHALEIYLTEFGAVNESEKNVIRNSINNCLNLLCLSLSEGTDVRKTSIDNTEIISGTQVTQSCVQALEYIKREKLPEYLSKGEVSEEVIQEVEKYLEFLIAKLLSN